MKRGRVACRSSSSEFVRIFMFAAALATPAFSKRVALSTSTNGDKSKSFAQTQNGFYSMQGASDSAEWRLELLGVSCYVADMAPFHGLDAQRLHQRKEAMGGEIQDEILDAIDDAHTEMIQLAKYRNCRLCDVNLVKDRKKGIKYDVQCSAKRLGKSTGSRLSEVLGVNTGTCFSTYEFKHEYGASWNSKDEDVAQLVSVKPVLESSAGDCRHCPPECVSCTQMKWPHKHWFSCVKKRQDGRRIPNYDCRNAFVRHGTMHVQCRFPSEKSKSPGQKDYRYFWSQKEQVRQAAESAVLNLHTVDCLNPTPDFIAYESEDVPEKSNTAIFEMQRAIQEELWTIAAENNVDKCSLTLNFKNGEFEGLNASHAIQEVGKEACSQRNGEIIPYITSGGCFTCPVECESCEVTAGDKFTCKLSETPSAFNSVMWSFLTSTPQPDRLKVVHGYSCSSFSQTFSNPKPKSRSKSNSRSEATHWEATCDMSPVKNFPVLPYLKDKSTLSEEALIRLREIQEEKTKILMGLANEPKAISKYTPPPKFQLVDESMAPVAKKPKVVLPTTYDQEGGQQDTGRLPTTYDQEENKQTKTTATTILPTTYDQEGGQQDTGRLPTTYDQEENKQTKTTATTTAKDSEQGEDEDESLEEYLKRLKKKSRAAGGSALGAILIVAISLL